MGAVIEEEGLVEIPGTEVAAQQGQYPVFGSDLSAKDAAQLGKADEALQKVGLTVEVLYRLGHRVECLIGKVPQKAGPLPQQLGYQPVKIQLFFRQAGEKTPAYQICAHRGADGQLPQHPPGVVRVCGDRPNGKQRRRKVLIAADCGGDFFVAVALENAAEESLKAAVITVSDILGHGILRAGRSAKTGQTAESNRDSCSIGI